MPIIIKKKPNFTKYKSRLDNIPQKTLQSLANRLTVGIIKRTQSGRDVNKGAFKPYSKVYGKKGTVNLTVTGIMLHSIASKIGRNIIRLFFSSTSENAKAYDNQVKYGRKFFGIDKSQRDLIKKRLMKIILG